MVCDPPNLCTICSSRILNVDVIRICGRSKCRTRTCIRTAGAGIDSAPQDDYTCQLSSQDLLFNGLDRKNQVVSLHSSTTSMLVCIGLEGRIAVISHFLTGI
jgi:hypothetical protein